MFEIIILDIGRNHAHRNRLSFESAQILHIIKRKLGSGDKRAHAVQICDNAALYGIDHLHFGVRLILQHLGKILPCQLLLCFAAGQKNISASVIRAEYNRLDLVADLHIVLN